MQLKVSSLTIDFTYKENISIFALSIVKVSFFVEFYPNSFKTTAKIVKKMSFHVRMVSALRFDGAVIVIQIVMMVQMKLIVQLQVQQLQRQSSLIHLSLKHQQFQIIIVESDI